MPTVKTVSKTTTKAAPAATKTKVVEVPAAPAPAPAQTNPKKFEPNDLITVRSITQGELIMPGKKSGIVYRWYAYGDTCEVEYQDLYTLKSSKSRYIYNPYFIIENDELLADPRWADVKKLYDSVWTDDIDEILKMRPSEFEVAFSKMPKGFQNAVKIEVATRIDEGTFDSISMIKAIDRICGSDLLCTVH